MTATATARALIVVLWRAGLRVQEALSLAETDLDERRGSLLVVHGKGGRRREIGMDAWGWEQLRPWLAARAAFPVGPMFCVIDGPTRAAEPGQMPRCGLSSTASPRRPGGGDGCAAPAPPRPRRRTRARGRRAQHHPAPA